MKIAESARRQLEALVASSAQGAMPSLLLGYTYDEHRNKTPQVDVTIFSAEQASDMRRDLADTRKQLLYDLDGMTFLLPLSYDAALVEGWLMVYTAAGFAFVRASN